MRRRIAPVGMALALGGGGGSRRRKDDDDDDDDTIAAGMPRFASVVVVAFF
jgi:hypothetical protein